MDTSVKMAVCVALASHIVSGRSYHDHDDLHNDWQNQAPHYQPRSTHYKRYHNHQHHKESWNHPEAWELGSWIHQDFHNRRNPYEGWKHHTLDQWPHSNSDWLNKEHWHIDNLNRESDFSNKAQRTPPDRNAKTLPTTSPISTTTDSSMSKLRDILATTLCIRKCPVTSEYNPVCGSNNVTYSNPGRLECAKYCGVDVTLLRDSPCSPANGTLQPSQPQQALESLQPITPVRHTTIVLPATTPAPVKPYPPVVTISPEILNSIFTPATTTVDDQYDIDIRTRSRSRFDAQPLQYVYPVPG